MKSSLNNVYSSILRETLFLFLFLSIFLLAIDLYYCWLNWGLLDKRMFGEKLWFTIYLCFNYDPFFLSLFLKLFILSWLFNVDLLRDLNFLWLFYCEIDSLWMLFIVCIFFGTSAYGVIHFFVNLLKYSKFYFWFAFMFWRVKS